MTSFPWLKSMRDLLTRPVVRRPICRASRLRLEVLEDRTVPSAMTYTVNTTEDSEAGSLRQAILDANANEGADVITFNILGAGPHTIQPFSALPTITEAVTIDGWSEPDFAGTPVVELRGTSAGAGVNGLTITASNCVVRGLVVNGFGGSGIRISGPDATGNVVAGNYIGTNAAGNGVVDGNVAWYKGESNAQDSASANHATVVNNVTYVPGQVGQAFQLSGVGSGILVPNSPSFEIGAGNFTLESWIKTSHDYTGVNTGGIILRSYSGTAVYSLEVTESPSPGNANRASLYLRDSAGAVVWVQGTTFVNDGQWHHIAGVWRNKVAEIYVDGVLQNSIAAPTLGVIPSTAQFINIGVGQGGAVAHFVGTLDEIAVYNRALTSSELSKIAQLARSTLLGNVTGVQVSWGASGNTIGGTTATTRNIISGNSQSGVIVYGANENTILGNFIGTNAAGTAAVPNGYGVRLLDDANRTTIGGSTPGSGNVISGNAGSGVLITGSGTTGNVIAGNYIGTDVTGTVAVGNGYGVLIEQGASSNIIGGTTGGAGNVISANSTYNVAITGAGTDGTVIQGNYIGTNAAGTAALGSSITGVAVYFDFDIAGPPEGTVFGGDDDDDGALDGVVTTRNVVSGNYGHAAIRVYGAPGTIIRGNYAGFAADGQTVIGSAPDGGISIDSDGVMIGGTTAGAGNVVAFWVQLFGRGHVVQGNVIGQTADGSAATPGGLDVRSVDTLIGGTTAVARNIISAISVTVQATSTTPVLIQGNYVGTDPTGTAARHGNGNYSAGNVAAAGIYLNASSVVVGGTTAGAANLISGNDGAGILVEGLNNTGNILAGNRIGPNAPGTATLPNAVGILIQNGSSGNTVGGTTPGAGNVISGNIGPGIVVQTGFVQGANTVRNSIRQNLISGNGGLGIDLGNDGVTANDAQDTDVGANGLQNFPVLTSAQGGSTTTVQGTLNSTPNMTFTLDFYASTTADPSGYGEGGRYLGSVSGVITNDSGNATFTATGLAAITFGEVITATATGPDGNTSEFSAISVPIFNGPPTVTANWAAWTYDGTAHAASGSVTGIGWADLRSPTSFTYYVGAGIGGTNLGESAPVNAGTYTVVAHYASNANYLAADSAPVTVTVAKANASIVVTPYDLTYDGVAHTATGTATGVNGEDLSGGLDLSGTVHTNAGTYSDTWTFIDTTGNYNDASTPDSYSLATLASFNWANGAGPWGDLVADSNGNLFGTTVDGGAFGYGTVFEVAAGNGAITTLASFDYWTNGASPYGDLIADSSGNLFGTTYLGGASGVGTVFKLVAGSSSTITTLASFDYWATGAYPTAGLIADSNGNLFGTTGAGGPSGAGTVFKLAVDSGTITTLASFNGDNGANPTAGLIADSNGNLFGTTGAGGPSGAGTVFKLAVDSGTITTLASFDYSNGAYPYGGLVADSSGNLFGTTYGGGAFVHYGTVFEVAAGSRTITTLASFDWANGASPYGALIADSSGNLLGTTYLGGASGAGTVFKLVAGSSTITTLASFNGANGANPSAGLIADSSGNLFGATVLGGASDRGTVFKLAANLPSGVAGTVTNHIANANVTIQGTPGNDLIVLDAGPQPDKVRVTLNGNLLGTFPVSGTITVLGGDGDDAIVVNTLAGTSVILDGQGGSDTYTVNLTQLRGLLRIGESGTTGQDHLIINATADDDYIDKDAGTIKWWLRSDSPESNPVNPPALATITSTGVEKTKIYLGGGNDFVLDPGEDTELIGGPGVDTFVITGTFGAGVRIEDRDGATEVIIHLGKLAGPVTVDVDGSFEPVVVRIVGTDGADTIRVSQAGVTTGTGEVIALIGFVQQLSIDFGTDGGQLILDDLGLSPTRYNIVAADNGANVDVQVVGVPPSDLTVNGNHAPIAHAGGPYIIAEGQSVTLDASGSHDPDAGDTLTYSWDVNGDGVFGDATGVNPTLTWTQLVTLGLGNGLQLINVRVRVDDGVATAVVSMATTLTIHHEPPVVNLGGNAAINENGTFTRAASFVGTGSTFTATVNYGDGSGTHALSLNADKSFSLSHVYVSPGAFTVTVQVVDGHGDTGTGTLIVTVNNLAPVVQPITGPGSAIPGQVLAFVAAFTDGGSHTALWSWGDGDTNPAIVSEANGSGTSSGSHAYAANGTYTVTVTVKDSGMISASRTFTVIVANAVYVLNTSASGALTISGNGSIHVPGMVVVDSNSASALSASGNAQISASTIKIVGGFSRSGNASLSPSPQTHVAIVLDPLAALTAPTSGVARGSVNLTGNNSLTINPGVYSQITVAGNARLTLNPGVYIIAGGGLSVSGNATVTGTGVVFYNAGSNFPSSGGNFGGIALSGNGSFNLTAPTSGPYVGIVIFQARDNTRALALSGNGMLGLQGSIYAPVALLALSGNAAVNNPLVVNTLTISGNGSSTLATDGADSHDSSAGQLLAINIYLYIDYASNGGFTSAQAARIQDAVAGIETLLAPYGVVIVVVDASERDLANFTLDIAPTTANGGLAQGILGSTKSTGEITLVSGWDWFTGMDSSAIQPGQYDFQTVVTHELGHALGLGHSTDPSSVMYATLAPAQVRRTITVADLAVPDLDQQVYAHPLLAAPFVEAQGSGCGCALCTGAASLAGQATLSQLEQASAEHLPWSNNTLSNSQALDWQSSQWMAAVTYLDPASPGAFLAKWTTADTYEIRVPKALESERGPRIRGSVLLKTDGLRAIVFDESDNRTLHDDSSRDWFFAKLGEAVVDDLTDRANNDLVLDID